MSNNMFEDLIVDIFSRLPTKSLLRFRSVSKSLHASIGSPSFTRLHTLRSSKKVIIIHKKHCEGDACAKHIYTLHPEGRVRFRPYTGITPIECPFTSNLRIVGSCNGILCVYEHENDGFHLWNPSIRRKVAIHDFPPPPSSSSSTSHCLLQGFGFDPVVDDYKILRVSKASSFVYTMNTHTWREIASPTSTFSCWRTYQCLFNGVLHWVVNLSDSNNAYHHNCLMTFDLSSEVFSTIELPETTSDTNEVTIFKGCLAVISSDGNNNRIWVRSEHNDTASWVVAYKMRINPFVGAILRVLPSASNGDILFSRQSNEMQLYNSEKLPMAIWNIKNFGGCSRMVDMDMFDESLGLLDMGTSCDQGSKVA